MKKTTLTEDARLDFQTFFDEQSFIENQIAVNKTAALQDSSAPENAAFLDKFLAAVKWIFLYFPGVVAIHFIITGFALSLFYGDWFIELFLGMLSIFAVSTFMIMLGIGKLRDLKYLIVVLGIFLTSSLAAVLYAILAVLIPGDFFGFYVKMTLALPVLIGYLAKRKIDDEAED
jgi:hypothetical protein